MRITKFLFLLFIPLIIFGQNEGENQSIELPDFVITGMQSVNVPTVSKPDPKVVLTLSEEFFRPVYSPEDFSLAKLTDSFEKAINPVESIDEYNGYLKIGAGIESLPVGEFNWGKNFGNYLLNAKVWGSNIKDYSPNSGSNVSGGSIKNSFFTNHKAEFLPGLKISLDAEYYKNNYKYFASLTPTLERENHFGNAALNINNSFGKTVNFGLNLTGDYLLLKENDVTEKIFSGNVFFALKFSQIDFKIEGEYKKQQLDNTSLVSPENEFYSGEFSINAKPSRNIALSLGAHYSKEGDNEYFAPTAGFMLGLSDNFYLFGEYSPSGNYLGIKDLIFANRYYQVTTVPGLFVKTKNDAKIFFKYEFEKYFEINAGGSYSKADNFFYFDDTPQPGKFDIITEDDVQTLSGFINVLFHQGPYGSFYGEAIYKEVAYSNGNILPYQPKLVTSLNYGYNFAFGFSLDVIYKLAFGSYTDKLNTNELPHYQNLTISGKYELLKNFSLTVDFENVLDNENYIWDGYLEKPFDVIAGIVYRW